MADSVEACQGDIVLAKDVLSSRPLSESIAEMLEAPVTDMVETGIDSILSSESLMGIPVVSSAIALFRIGSDIRDRFCLVKFVAFLDEFNKASSEEEVRARHASRFREENRERDLEYLIIVTDRYISLTKARYLARSYEAYLDRRITWSELLVFAEVIDRLLPGDYDVLFLRAVYETRHAQGAEVMLRLVGLGLMIEDPRKTDMAAVDDGQGNVRIVLDESESSRNEKRVFRRTAFGEKMVAVLGEAIFEDE